MMWFQATGTLELIELFMELIELPAMFQNADTTDETPVNIWCGSKKEVKTNQEEK